MTMNNEDVSIWKDIVMGYFKVLSELSPWNTCTEENH
jgi:hypothetical protein